MCKAKTIGLELGVEPNGPGARNSALNHPDVSTFYGWQLKRVIGGTSLLGGHYHHWFHLSKQGYAGICFDICTNLFKFVNKD